MSKDCLERSKRNRDEEINQISDQDAERIHSADKDIGKSSKRARTAEPSFWSQSGIPSAVAIEEKKSLPTIKPGQELYELALMYEQGNGVEKNINTAAEIYQQAVAKGHVQAHIKLGEYYSGIDASSRPRDLAKGIQLLTVAAEKGDAEGQYALACAIAIKISRTFGEERISQMENYRKWLMASAAKGHGDAKYNLAYIYQEGIFGLKQNTQKAEKLYVEAVKAGHKKARLHLAALYRNGEHVEQNLDKAVELFTAAALDDDDRWGKGNLSDLYETGRGVKQNEELAKELRVDSNQEELRLQ